MTPEIEKRIKAVKAGRVPAAHCLDGKKMQWNHLQISDLFDEVCEKKHPDADVLTIIQGTGTVLREESGREIIYDENSLANYKFVKKGDFIIHLRSFEGGLEVANQDGIVSPAYIILRPKIDVSTVYLYALFHSNQFINQTMAPAVEGARDGRSVKYDVLKKQKIFLPPFAEQKKIADILSAQDKIIELKEKLISQKQLQKKYLTQILFNKEKQKFIINGIEINKKKWENTTIGKIAHISTGNKDTQDKKDDGAFPFYVRSPNPERIDTYSYDGEAILTAGDGVGVGKVIHYVTGKFDFHQRVYKISDFCSNAMGKYVFYFFSEFFYNRVIRMSAKNSVDSVRYNMIADMPIVLPSLPEQQAIAAVLSSADEEISLLQRDLEQEKLKKKSLMQLLLTGLVRV